MMEALGYLWLRPIWAALVPVAILLGFLLVRQAGRLGAWERAADPELLAAMRRMGRVHTGKASRNWLPALVLVGLGIALAGPGIERRNTDSYRNLDAVVLVLDLSPSVTGGGRLFDTLSVARLLAQAAGTRQTGLVIYAGEAYVAAPLSTDSRALDGTLALLDAKTLPVQGSRPETGIVLAHEMLQTAHIVSADVVLIGDGTGIGPRALAGAEQLKQAGIVVSAIQVPGGGSEEARNLATLARIGGGAFGRLEDPLQATGLLRARPVERLVNTGYASLVVKDLGRYLLLLVLVPAFLLLPRRART